MASSLSRIHDHTQTHLTWRDSYGRVIARRTDLYLTTHNTHKRQTSMPLEGFEPTIPASEQPQIHALDRAATRIGISYLVSQCKWYVLNQFSAAARLLGLWVRIPSWAWMFVSCECCVLSGRGLFDGQITRPEESYRACCVWVWSWTLDNEEAVAN